ncbi:Hydroxyproline O-arabinosyltransferase [Heracleum sosnowskyi]|uniref:Hydroxyproline O-arabinosyltransferase n=1 Tax=Heracleum sosnowskyi TaxID=360622 RepID=A0AAD8HPB4_9APIA|nr:Hydroxyproline O-arabinosyltransferase [Heracleum sosnowskyi]
MGSGYLLLIIMLSFTVAMITYNTIISTQSFKQELLAVSNSDVFSVDPVIEMPMDTKTTTSSSENNKKRMFHTAVTASEGVYSLWQCRIMYYWFKKFKNGPNSEMGGFTRILHSGFPDDYMHEIPTFVVQPLPDGMDQGYIVLHRPWAFVQWLELANIEEDYILMAEPDHIIMKPIPNLSQNGLPAAFPFSYIEPKKEEAILRKFFPEEKGPITNIDPIGNSPVIIHKEILYKIAPTWMNVSLAMKRDPEADLSFEWVLEMYAYAVSSALHGVISILYKDFMIQPPWDRELGNKYILHYTYGCDYDMKGQLMDGKFGEWRFDKRSYETTWPSRNLPLPPPGVPESVVTLVKMVNEATANLPKWGS